MSLDFQHEIFREPNFCWDPASLLWVAATPTYPDGACATFAIVRASRPSVTNWHDWAITVKVRSYEYKNRVCKYWVQEWKDGLISLTSSVFAYLQTLILGLNIVIVWPKAYRRSGLHLGSYFSAQAALRYDFTNSFVFWNEDKYGPYHSPNCNQHVTEPGRPREQMEERRMSNQLIKRNACNSEGKDRT